MRVLHTQTPAGRAFLRRVTSRAADDLARVMPRVKRIMQDVREKGDPALKRYAVQLDRLGARRPLRVSAAEMHTALKSLTPELRDAIEFAAENIRRFAEWQKPAEFRRELRPGVMVGQVLRPLEAVGCYVPGGRYPLPSTVLMTVIPAQVAGVHRIVVCSPDPPSETIAAAALLGITEFYRVGGAQAIAAMAYGTKSIERVDKIFGPGNSFVTAAKKMVSHEGACSIDMLAGPTEALVVSRAGDAEYIAADLVAQAEHDPQTTCIFISDSAKLAAQVAEQCKLLSAGNPIAAGSLAENGAALVTRSRKEALAIADQIGSEHLTVDGEEDVASVRTAGSIFIGNYSAQPLGDYVSGPNHVLPTAGTARVRGGLSVMDFLKVITVQQVSARGIESLAGAAVELANAEQLVAHAAAVRIRTKLNAHAAAAGANDYEHKPMPASAHVGAKQHATHSAKSSAGVGPKRGARAGKSEVSLA